MRLSMSGEKSAEKTGELVEEKPIVKEGDLILVDYTFRVKENGELIETTIKAVSYTHLTLPTKRIV